MPSARRTWRASSRKIGAVPIEYRPRIGKPKLGKRHGVRIMLDALRLALRYNPAFLLFASALAQKALPGRPGTRRAPRGGSDIAKYAATMYPYRRRAAKPPSLSRRSARSCTLITG
jgi:hypothetical protein